MTSFFCDIDFEIGPLIYFDIKLFFLLILIAELSPNKIILWSLYFRLKRERQTQDRQISPLILYLYLKPLYSIRGGSTTLAEPLINKPSLVNLLKDPLYNWKIFNHLTLVLSVIYNQDSLANNETLINKQEI